MNPQSSTFPSIDSPNPSISDSLSRHAEWQHEQYQQLSSGSGRTGVEAAMWRMTLLPQESMDSSYPERPGEPDCAYYMRNGLCGFGAKCKFNHPPNWRQAAAATWSRGEYPERIGQPECQYYLKTGTCKFGATCKFHHPREKVGLAAGSTQLNALNLPLRPGEKDCAYYMRTGTCKYEVTCKFNHPQPVVSMQGSSMFLTVPLGSASAPQLYPANLPAWPMARLPYLRPPSIAGTSNFAPVVIPSPPGVVSVQTWNPYQAPLGTIQDGQQALPTSYIYRAAVPSQEPMAMGLYPSYMPGPATMRLPTHLSPTTSGHNETLYPERPGQAECQYYMKTGECRFGSHCKFHHPKDRSVSTQGSFMGLPLRPGAPLCTFFSRFGFCKFGQTCKFDHSYMPTVYSPLLYSMELLASPSLNAPSESPFELEGPPSSTEFLEGGGVLSASMQ